MRTPILCISYDFVDNASSVTLASYVNKCARFRNERTDLTDFDYECEICSYNSDGTVNYIPTGIDFCCP